MFDYTALQIIWWAILGIIMIVYSTTAGFDFGVTMIMPFLKKEEDRKLALAASMPTWDGNMTWVVFFGGALFVAWPVVYGTAFSGLYFAFFAVLWSTFLRPPGFDYRERIDSHVWRRCWDVALFISSVVPVLIFGVGMANCLLGFPFDFDKITMRDFYHGDFGDLLTGYAWLGGFLSLSMIAMHGASYLLRRVNGPLKQRAKKLHVIFSLFTFVFYTLFVILVTVKMKGYHLAYSPVNATAHPLDNIVQYVPHAWRSSYGQYPWKYYPIIIFYFAIVISLWANYLKAYATAFWCSCFTIGGIIASCGATLYPFVMPSSLKPAQSLTVFDATASEYSLGIMLYVGIVLLMVILAYKIFAYSAIWRDKPSIGYEDIKTY
jgi:cytochrome d ubiquinol oxidase subunit II